MSDLTAAEQANVKKALAFLRLRCGGPKNLAKVLRISRSKVYGPPTPAIVFRIARLAEVGVDDVLAGRYPAHGVCAHCGHQKDDVAEK